MRNLITKYHENVNQPIPFAAQLQIHNSLQKYKVGEIYLYNHIVFEKCKELVSDCWRNRKKMKNLKIAKETGVSAPVGRPRDSADSKQMREAAKIAAPIVAPRCF